MEHTEAIKLNAVERYLLGELTPTERDAFEAHFFECADCAAEVRAAASFVVNAREIMRRKPTEQWKPGHELRAAWLRWLRPGYALAAIAILVLAIGYQNFITIPNMKRNLAGAAAQALPTLSLTASASRAEAGIAEIALRPNSSFGIFVDIPPHEGFVSYSCVIRGGDGRVKYDIDVSAVQARDTVELFIPGGTLDPGPYHVVIIGKAAHGLTTSEEEVARFPFALKNIR